MRLIGAFATASAATTEVLHRREMSRRANRRHRPLVRNERGRQLMWPNSLSFFSMRIATIAAPIGFADVGN